VQSARDARTEHQRPPPRRARRPERRARPHPRREKHPLGRKPRRNRGLPKPGEPFRQCRGGRSSRSTQHRSRVVAASLLRVLERGEFEWTVLTADTETHLLRSPAGPHLRGFSSHAALTRLSPTASTPPDQNALTCHYALILDWPGRPRTVPTTCAMWYRTRRRRP
jgi:hypothetical protein